jgi:hypothetical protein
MVDFKARGTQPVIRKSATSVQSKESQPRDGEADRKADNGLRQVDDDGDADDGAHVSLQSGPRAIYKPKKV